MALSPYFMPTDAGDNAFTVEAPKIKFGAGALAEIGQDAAALCMTRIAVFTDRVVKDLPALATVTEALQGAGLNFEVYTETEVEPTDRSFKAAAEFARQGKFDGYISVGGGSVMDTAKAANLYATYPDDFLAYVNAPVGQAKPVPGPLKPHIACPTTFGTASECTGIAIFDFLEMEAKTGIANARLRPSLGILDPTNLASLPPLVLGANGFDVFSHAFESLTARPFTHRAKPATSSARPLSQGANPYSDLACRESIRLIGDHLVSAVNDPTEDDYEALMFAGMLAGIGFGNAGCHIPHAMSYAVAGLVRDYQPPGWPSNHAMVPHGISVIVNAPAVFRFTGPACPDRHRLGAQAMGASAEELADQAPGDALANRIEEMMRATGIPNGLTGVGYSMDDLDNLVSKAAPQRRLLDNAPLAIAESELRKIFTDAMRYW
ncbi:MAG: alcohol dehydrogenase [Rhodospirillaceae bacterium]|jgi:alcohol dehydrogenase class IV|uniref:hydroxyacid-oxoacid transhydrogenase n=1 Tax=Hwanghaeella sp. 1Z406 TaxID=3402811 RepID=UPI000C4EBE55|nr:alcohol dehydrogenase [Rhodospirillales bacterium]MAX48265.1 alcohol dehydrogenase [Rhodospirillaceae bacterium]|tara:strand:- start:42168 stop:43472 length:1305 start_codon:yes stop_codon:yes gene_type:complete